MSRPSPRTVRRLIGLALLVLWEAIPRLGILPELFIPPFTKTITVLWLDRDSYRVHGVFTAGAKATSVLLPGFEVEVSAVFTAGTAGQVIL